MGGEEPGLGTGKASCSIQKSVGNSHRNIEQMWRGYLKEEPSRKSNCQLPRPKIRSMSACLRSSKEASGAGGDQGGAVVG